jgi:hypothetical protein
MPSEPSAYDWGTETNKTKPSKTVKTLGVIAEEIVEQATLLSVNKLKNKHK